MSKYVYIFFLCLFIPNFSLASYPASQNFVDNGDGTITDTSTDLMWCKDSFEACGGYSIAVDENTAVYDVENLTYAGYDDWRLPTVEEMNTIIGYNIGRPFCASGFWGCTTLYSYWTSSQNPDDFLYFWTWSLGVGALDPLSTYFSQLAVYRAVRTIEPPADVPLAVSEVFVNVMLFGALFAFFLVLLIRIF